MLTSARTVYASIVGPQHNIATDVARSADVASRKTIVTSHCWVEFVTVNTFVNLSTKKPKTNRRRRRRGATERKPWIYGSKLEASRKKPRSDPKNWPLEPLKSPISSPKRRRDQRRLPQKRLRDLRRLPRKRQSDQKKLPWRLQREPTRSRLKPLKEPTRSSCSRMGSLRPFVPRRRQRLRIWRSSVLLMSWGSSWRELLWIHFRISLWKVVDPVLSLFFSWFVWLLR